MWFWHTAVVFILLLHCQWKTWDRIRLSSFPVFHSKLAVEMGLESRSPNLGDFSISSDHVQISSFFHKILLTWHMPSVLFYNRCFEGGAVGLFHSPSKSLTLESLIMSEMALSDLFPQRSTSPFAHPFSCSPFPSQENTVLTVPFSYEAMYFPPNNFLSLVFLLSWLF